MKTTVFLVDDHPVAVDGLRRAINAQDDMEVVGEARDGIAALREIEKVNPSIVVLDIEMPGMSGTLVASELAKCSKARIIVLSAYDSMDYVRQLLLTGVAGYVLKSCEMDEIFKAIRHVRDGHNHFCAQLSSVIMQDYKRRLRGDNNALDILSLREREILEMVAEGMGRLDIARRLSIDAKTVDKHRARIKEKLGLASTAELTKFAVSQGISSLNLGARHLRGKTGDRPATP